MSTSRPDYLGRILAGGFPGAESDKCNGYRQDSHKGDGKNPPRDGDAVGKLLKPAGGYPPGNWGGSQEPGKDQFHITVVEHPHQLPPLCAVNFADGNLAAAVLGLKHHNPEHSHKGYKYCQQGKKAYCNRCLLG